MTREEELFIDPNPPEVEPQPGDCDCTNLLRRIKELERAHDAVARYITEFVQTTNNTLYDLTNRIETLERNCNVFYDPSKSLARSL